MSLPITHPVQELEGKKSGPIQKEMDSLLVKGSIESVRDREPKILLESGPGKKTDDSLTDQ